MDVTAGPWDGAGGLPAPSADARAHGERVAAHIGAAIDAAGGALPFERFMELALYAPGLGYYSAGSTKFGVAGDFVTAPELSPLFGRCVARQVEEILTAIGGGSILEIGAGGGALAAELLTALASRDALPERYLILERSAELRDRQARLPGERLPALNGRIGWLDELPATGFVGVVLANEVLDAIPARRFRINAGAIEEGRVANGDSGFVWRYVAPTDPELDRAVRAIEGDLKRSLVSGNVSEIAPLRDAWVAGIGERLRRGALLLIDYGYPRGEYYHPQRTDGTLMCHYRHRAHGDPLVLVGLQDVSVHVEFTAVALAAESVALGVAGLTTQAEFLLACGVLDMAAELPPSEPAFLAASQELKTLLLPGQMGELIKVMALTRDLDTPFIGFGGRDLLGRL